MRTPHPGITQAEWDTYYHNSVGFGSHFAHRSHDEHCGYEISTFATCSASGTIRYGYSLSSTGFSMNSGAKYGDRVAALTDAMEQAKAKRDALEKEVEELYKQQRGDRT